MQIKATIEKSTTLNTHQLFRLQIDTFSVNKASRKNGKDYKNTISELCETLSKHIISKIENPLDSKIELNINIKLKQGE